MVKEGRQLNKPAVFALSFADWNVDRRTDDCWSLSGRTDGERKEESRYSCKEVGPAVRT